MIHVAAFALVFGVTAFLAALFVYYLVGAGRRTTTQDDASRDDDDDDDGESLVIIDEYAEWAIWRSRCSPGEQFFKISAN